MTVFSSVYIYDFIYCILEIVSPYTKLYVWPSFLSLLSMLTTLGCSPRAVWSQVWRDIPAGAGFGARSRLVDMYIYQLCILFTWQTTYEYEICIIDIVQYHLCIDYVSFASALRCLICIYHVIYLFMYILIIIYYPCDVRLIVSSCEIVSCFNFF